MNCYVWELDALLEGLVMGLLDEQEREVAFGFRLRYILNAKKPKPKRVFNKQKEEARLRKLFCRNETQREDDERTNRVAAILRANRYFRQKVLTTKGDENNG